MLFVLPESARKRALARRFKNEMFVPIVFHFISKLVYFYELVCNDAVILVSPYIVCSSKLLNQRLDGLSDCTRVPPCACISAYVLDTNAKSTSVSDILRHTGAGKVIIHALRVQNISYK